MPPGSVGGMNKQRVYRSGSMTPCPTAGAANAVTVAADALRPHTTGRLGSLFAAPTLTGAARWVLGNDMCGYETRVREITIDADTTYVYSVDAWEHTHQDRPDSLAAYWATGMTLTDWLARAEAEELDGAQWEVLIDPAAVLGVRNVSAKRLLAAAPQWRASDVQRVVRRWRLAA